MSPAVQMLAWFILNQNEIKEAKMLLLVARHLLFSCQLSFFRAYRKDACTSRMPPAL